MAIPSLLFRFFVFVSSKDKCKNICQWLDSNHGPQIHRSAQWATTTALIEQVCLIFIVRNAPFLVPRMADSYKMLMSFWQDIKCIFGWIGCRIFSPKFFILDVGMCHGGLSTSVTRWLWKFSSFAHFLPWKIAQL